MCAKSTSSCSSHVEAIEGGIFHEDMAVAILDAVEEHELAYKY